MAHSSSWLTVSAITLLTTFISFQRILKHHLTQKCIFLYVLLVWLKGFTLKSSFPFLSTPTVFSLAGEQSLQFWHSLSQPGALESPRSMSFCITSQILIEMVYLLINKTTCTVPGTEWDTISDMNGLQVRVLGFLVFFFPFGCN